MKKNVGVKNYILYAVLVVVTMVLVFYLGKWYQTSENYRKDTSVIASVLSEIKLNELDSYLMENPNPVVYIKNNQTSSYEEELKEIVIRYNLRDEMIFLNLNDENDLKKFEEKYQSGTIFLPNLCVFDEGKLVAFMDEKSVLTEETTLQFLKQNGVIVE